MSRLPVQSSRRELLHRIVLLVVGVALSLLIAEGLVRLAGLGNTTITRGRLHAYDPELGWIGTPGLDARFQRPGSFDVAIHMNAHGTRGPEVAFERRPGVRRVVVLGDSGAWGQGVEDDETFSGVIEDALADTEVVNLGANGYSTVQSLLRLERDGLRYAPDWTLYAFSLNDLGDNFDDKHGGRPVIALRDDGGIELRNHPVRRAWKAPSTQWLRHHSRLFGLLEYGNSLWRVRWRELRAGAVPPDSPEAFAFSLHAFYAPPSPAMERSWTAMHAILERLARDVRERGGRLIVIYNTAKQEVDARLFERAVGGPSEPLDVALPARRLGEICAALGIAYLDPTEAFRAQDAPAKTLFLRRDPHWSAAGHRVAGRLAAEMIRRLEGAPEAAPPQARL